MGSPSILGAPPTSPPPTNLRQCYNQNPTPFAWKELYTSRSINTRSFALNFVPLNLDEVTFSQDELFEGKKEWELSLVGHTIKKDHYAAP